VPARDQRGLYCGDASAREDPRAVTLSRGAADWQLLLQLDSEPEPAEMLWGDAGRVYFWMRAADLRSIRPEAAWAICSAADPRQRRDPHGAARLRRSPGQPAAQSLPGAPQRRRAQGP
jgi:hypothetical protein